MRLQRRQTRATTPLTLISTRSLAVGNLPFDYTEEQFIDVRSLNKTLRLR